MKKNIAKVMEIVLTISMIASLSACGGAKIEETTLADAPTTPAIETTEASTEEESTTPHVVETSEGETIPANIPTGPSPYPDTSNIPDSHIYEVFTDGEEHQVTFAISEKEGLEWYNNFKSFSYPEWGIESISVPETYMDPTDMVKVDQSVRNDLTKYKWENDKVYDVSDWYDGNLAIISKSNMLMSWRASTKDYVIDEKNLDNAKIYAAYYPFYDVDLNGVEPNTTYTFDEGNGVKEYTFMLLKNNAWAEDGQRYHLYGDMVVRVDPKCDYVHCIIYADGYSDAGEDSYHKVSNYVLFNSAKYSDLDDITGGEICEIKKSEQ